MNHHLSRLLLATLLLSPLAARAADPAAPRTITTTGQATLYVVPDQALLTLGIETFSASLDQAKSDNDAASAKLLKSIASLAIDPKHVQTDVMTTGIRYQEWEHPSKGIEGYFCRRAYIVTLKDVKKLEPLIDLALKNGANQLVGFEYRTADLRKHRDAARKQAIAAAHEKAIALANELGQHAGPARTITEGPSNYYGLSYSYANNYAQQSQNPAQSDLPPTENGDTLPPGQIAVRADITVTFDLLN